MNTRTSRAIANRLHQSVAPAVGPFDDTPDAVAAEVVLVRGPRRRQEVITTLGTTEKPARKKPVVLDPMQRRWFERHGWQFDKTEHKNAFSGKKHDLWGFGDWLCLDDAPGSVIVQTTMAGSNLSARLRKSEAIPELRGWLERKNRFEVHGWHQPKGPGTAWVVRRVRVVLEGGELKREMIGAEEGAKG